MNNVKYFEYKKVILEARLKLAPIKDATKRQKAITLLRKCAASYPTHQNKLFREYEKAIERYDFRDFPIRMDLTGFSDIPQDS